MIFDISKRLPFATFLVLVDGIDLLAEILGQYAFKKFTCGSHVVLVVYVRFPLTATEYLKSFLPIPLYFDIAKYGLNTNKVYLYNK